MRKIRLIILIIILCGIVSCSPLESNDSSDSTAYIQNKGSDTMVNLALAWAEAYQEIQHDVRISVTGGGSGTGISALMSDTVDMANASRAIKDEEIIKAESLGFTPVEFVVARDAIAIIINPENSVSKLTMQQLSQIYTGEITNWQVLGGEDRPIVKLSRETNSGTHTYFLETVVRLGNSNDDTIFTADTLLLPSSEGIISEVRDNPNAIGYDGLGYVTDEVKVVAIAPDESADFIYPSVETVTAGTYPISRDLYIYTRNQPEGEIKDYIDWIYSDQAQKIVSDLGFVPVSK